MKAAALLWILSSVASADAPPDAVFEQVTQSPAEDSLAVGDRIFGLAHRSVGAFENRYDLGLDGDVVQLVSSRREDKVISVDLKKKTVELDDGE